MVERRLGLPRIVVGETAGKTVGETAGKTVGKTVGEMAGEAVCRGVPVTHEARGKMGRAAILFCDRLPCLGDR